MCYVAVLMKFCASLGRRRGIDRDEQWSWQDGGHPHTTNDSLAWLKERFKDKLISRKCKIEWATHSPDLNPPIFLYITTGLFGLTSNLKLDPIVTTRPFSLPCYLQGSENDRVVTIDFDLARIIQVRFQ
jgi:hypothetical protein